MIPLLAVVHVRQPKGAFRLWVPLFLVWPFLALVLALLSPLLAVACLAMRLSPGRVAVAFLSLICGLNGLLVDVDSPAARVLVAIQ